MPDASAAAATTTSAAESAADTRRTGASSPAPASFDRYRRLLELNPFSPRLPKKVAPPVITPVNPPPVIPPVGPGGEKPAEVKKPDAPPAPPAVPAPPDPLKDWVYSGTVAIGGDVYAVVENKANKQGRYVKVGDDFEGATVDQVAQSDLVITLNGQSRTLPKSTAFNVTPLNGAGGAAPGGGPGAPGPGGPGAPGAPGGKPGGPAPAGAPAGLPAGARPATRMSAPVMMELSAPVPFVK
jgi:hypothetical protein